MHNMKQVRFHFDDDSLPMPAFAKFRHKVWATYDVSKDCDTLTTAEIKSIKSIDFTQIAEILKHELSKKDSASINYYSKGPPEGADRLARLWSKLAEILNERSKIIAQYQRIDSMA